ncbi:MAG: bifunctional diaminohydroxyphosphoribosylaminopyrimidine deaminase/5-amino-6-(5-phosphoribosylamino)uracil reductase RibD [Balneolales bacterium]
MARPSDKNDIKWMKKALKLAVKGKGYASPNPLVGCVIVSSTNEMLGQGFHERYGEAHAEVNALKSVNDKSKLEGATVYVTLEPCSHHGKTPPCAETLCTFPIGRVVCAMEDPNPQVQGCGIKLLKERGITVETGILEKEAAKMNEAFIFFMKYRKPYVILKIAQTLDGYISAPDGNSRWITSIESRKKVHEWRSTYDAVMIGRNTASTDNPNLTVRHVKGRQPKRVVIDGNLSLPKDLNLFTDQHEKKTIVITHDEEEYNKHADPMLNILQTNYFRGKTLLVSQLNGHSDLNQAIEKLGEMNITSVLVEAGSDLATALITQNLVDKIHLFIAPKILGGGARSVLGLGINHMEDVLKLHTTSWERSGEDMLFTGYF